LTSFFIICSAALRNSSAAQGQFGNLIFDFAITEALGIFSLLIALLLLFVVIVLLHGDANNVVHTIASRLR
jgi:hypothetical protein